MTAIGAHVTALPEESLRASRLDSVIRREPEMTADCLVDALEKRGHLSGVTGTSYRTETGIIHNKDRPFVENLDELPFPARDLIDNEKYTMPISNEPYTLVIASRGCPHQCIYCTAHLYYGHKLRLRSPDNVLDEIEEIVGKFGTKDVTLWSDTFTLDRNFVTEICQRIEERGLEFRWMANSRVDRVDPDLLHTMKSAGCTMLSFGVESGCQEILNNIKKKTTLEQIKNAFTWCHEAKIETIAHFVLGLPGENKDTVKQTLQLAKNIKPDYAQFYGAIPFPGTRFYQLAKENFWLVTDDWTKYELNQTVVSTPELSAAELDKAKRAAFKGFYLRPNYMLKRLGQVRSVREGLNLPKQSLNFMKEWVRSK